MRTEHDVLELMQLLESCEKVYRDEVRTIRAAFNARNHCIHAMISTADTERKALRSKAYEEYLAEQGSAFDRYVLARQLATQSAVGQRVLSETQMTEGGGPLDVRMDQYGKIFYQP